MQHSAITSVAQPVTKCAQSRAPLAGPYQSCPHRVFLSKERPEQATIVTHVAWISRKFPDSELSHNLPFVQMCSVRASGVEDPNVNVLLICEAESGALEEPHQLRLNVIDVLCERLESPFPSIGEGCQ